MDSRKLNYFAMMTRTLNNYNISWQEHKNNPALLYNADAGFRKYVQKNFKYKEDFMWYNKKLNWSKLPGLNHEFDHDSGQLHDHFNWGKFLNCLN